MSTWLPPVVPAAVEELWLPTGHSDNSIDPYLISCLEVALEKRREDTRTSSAPVPMGLASAGFRTAGDFAGDEMQGEEMDEDEDMDHDREEDDDLDEDSDDIASDEFTDEADLSLMDGTGREGDHLDTYDGTDDETDEDEDEDDDDLAGYL